MSGNALVTEVTWIFDKDAEQFLKDEGFSNEVVAPVPSPLPSEGDWVSWVWFADNQPFQVVNRWFIWDAERRLSVQLLLDLPQGH